MKTIDINESCLVNFYIHSYMLHFSFSVMSVQLEKYIKSTNIALLNIANKMLQNVF